MALIRTVIVDDSAFVRKTIREILAGSPQIDVVGTASNGADALQVVDEIQPDVVTCDLMMPVLDGVGFVREQMTRRPLPILLLTSSPQDAGQVLEALNAGAVDFIQKPTALAHEDLLNVRHELVRKVKAVAAASSKGLAAPLLQQTSVPDLRPANNIAIVVIGISTGGPQALRYLIPRLPADFPVPVVVVVHMPVGYTAMFAEKLQEISKLPVIEAFESCAVRPGTVLIAAAGHHLTFNGADDAEVMVRLSLEPRLKPHRPSVDVLFQSAAEVYGARVLGVVMTGMGNDGLEGAAWVKAQGGKVLTQDEPSSVIYGMPRAVVEAGLSDKEVPLERMVEEIAKRL